MKRKGILVLLGALIIVTLIVGVFTANNTKDTSMHKETTTEESSLDSSNVTADNKPEIVPDNHSEDASKNTGWGVSGLARNELPLDPLEPSEALTEDIDTGNNKSYSTSLSEGVSREPITEKKHDSSNKSEWTGDSLGQNELPLDPVD